MANFDKRSLEIIFFDMGGGHRNGAEGLAAIMAKQKPAWDVKLTNLEHIIKPLDMIGDVYNGILKRGWTYGSLPVLRGMQRTIKIGSLRMVPLLQRHWAQSNNDLIVSVIPNFNGPLFRALRRVRPYTPYVTVMTDFADCPPNFWQEKQDQFLICGTEVAFRQAEHIGYRPEQIFRTSGMILKPHFYEDQTSDRHVERAKLGLDPHLPTALIMFGGFGAQISETIVTQLTQSGLPMQSIVMCGHNDKLLNALKGVKNCHAVGFSKDVPYYMHLADFFIGKPGPGSISEALHMGLPVILERNARTMPQELPNTDWVGEHNLGIVINNFKEIVGAVQYLLEGDLLKQMRMRAQSLNNQALFEIPPIFEQIMNTREEQTEESFAPPFMSSMPTFAARRVMSKMLRLT